MNVPWTMSRRDAHDALLHRLLRRYAAPPTVRSRPMNPIGEIHEGPRDMQLTITTKRLRTQCGGRR